MDKTKQKFPGASGIYTGLFRATFGKFPNVAEPEFKQRRGFFYLYYIKITGNRQENGNP